MPATKLRSGKCMGVGGQRAWAVCLGSMRGQRARIEPKSACERLPGAPGRRGGDLPRASQALRQPDPQARGAFLNLSF